jgi:hypothetical protein
MSVRIPFRRTGTLALVLALTLAVGSVALGQGALNSGLSGRVTNDHQPLPGASVELKSPALQGTRVGVTSGNGDFVFAALPPGTYTVTFKMQGFETQTKTLDLVATQRSTLDIDLKIVGVSAEAVVTAHADTVSTTTQASTTLTTEITSKLPITRTVLAAVQLSSGVSATGPGGNISISGAQSFDSVYTVDGAVIQDNVRSTPNNLFIEDAVQETTTSVSSISAEYGRFTGGIVNTVTKSGGNVFSGSIRSTLTNDSWTGITPYRSASAPNGEIREQKVNPRYEATLGGPIWKDRIWFFGSGRIQNVTGSAQTAVTNISYATGNDEKRYQGKLTLTPVDNHALTASYLKVAQTQAGYVYPDPQHVMDLDSVISRDLPQEILSVNYTGTLSSSFFVEGLYSRRKFTFEGSGSHYTDLIKGTLMRDIAHGNFRYNSPTFCGVCDPEQRDNRDILVKGTYFLSTEKLGSHDIVVGYDNFAGQRKANNYQSGSNYRMFTTNTIVQNGDIFPVVGANSYIYYTPIDSLSKGTDTLTHSGFINDQWRLNARLTVNLGLRYDKNDAKDSRGVVTANDSAFSPRLAAAYDVSGKGALKVSASYAKYIGGIQDNLVDSSSNAGAPSTFIWYYDDAVAHGFTPPTFNVNPAPGQALVTRAQALQQIFDWFFAQGCPNLQTCRLPLGYALGAGVSRQIRDTLKSPYSNEYTVGVNGAIGKGGSYRVDFVRRDFGDFYNTVLNTQTGHASDAVGNSYDLGIVGNTNAYTRNYTALQTQFQYRLLDNRLFLGGNWTWAHTLGNIDGENATSGPLANVLGDAYPEYKDVRWNNPKGSLATDQRHRVRVFGSYDIIPNRTFGVNLSAVQAWETGVPYGAVGAVASRPYVTNPGGAYLTPPATVTYYYTTRDAYRTDNLSRTDLALNLSYRIAGTIELFMQPQVTNVFNNGAVLGVDTTVNRLAAFNPFTSTPVEGVNWSKGSNFGKARSANDYQQPRTFFVSMGARF